DAVADQLVRGDALHARDVLQPHGLRAGRLRERDAARERRSEGQGCDRLFHTHQNKKSKIFWMRPLCFSWKLPSNFAVTFATRVERTESVVSMSSGRTRPVMCSVCFCPLTISAWSPAIRSAPDGITSTTSASIVLMK